MTKAEHNRLYRDRHRAEWNAYRRQWRALDLERVNRLAAAAKRNARRFWRECFASVVL